MELQDDYKKFREKISHPAKKFWNIKNRYKLTEDEYSELLRQQNYKCPICGIDLQLISAGDVCVDHDHYSGKVRGILCKKCNVMLGMAEDDKEILRNGIRYIEWNEDFSN